MSVFETFYLLYKSDTTDLRRGSEEATNTTKKLKDSISNIDKATDKIGKKFGNLATQLTGTIAAFASIHALISGISNAVSYDIELGKTSRALGVNAEELDIWDNAVKQAGGTAEGFQNSLRSLAEHFHTTASVALKAFPQLADVFSRISRYSAFNLGKAYGLDEGTILLLQKGRREVEAFLKRQIELGVITKKDIEVTTSYNQELQNLGHAFRTLYNAIAIPLLPALSEFFVTLENGLLYLSNHRDLVIGTLVGIASTAISAAFAFGLLTFGMIGSTLLVIGLIALFALLFEDLSVYLKGGKSLLGEFLEEWKRLGDLVDKIIEGWEDKFLNFLDKFKLFKPIVDSIRNSDDTLYSINRDNGNRENLLGFLGKNQDIEKGKNLLISASNTPLNSQTSNSVLNSSAFNRNFTINSMPINIVTQATDAVGIATSLSLTLPDQYKQAVNNFADNNYA